MSFKRRYTKKYSIKPKANLVRRHITRYIKLPTAVNRVESGLQETCCYCHMVETIVRAWAAQPQYQMHQCMVSSLSAHLSIRPTQEFLNGTAQERKVTMSQYLLSARAMFIYLPQGCTFNYPTKSSMEENSDMTGTIYEHPEWVMAEKYFSFNTNSLNQMTLTSKLKRNLLSSDRIVLVIEVLADQGIITMFGGRLQVDCELRYATYHK